MRRLRRIVRRTIVMGLLSCAFGSGIAIAAGTQTVTVESRTITVRIDRPLDKVYEFLVDPANWNQWAFGLGKNIRRSQDGWIADSDGGVTRVQFTARNSFGVLDHTVLRASGQRVYVPMRLLENGSRCSVSRAQHIRRAVRLRCRICGARPERVENAARKMRRHPALVPSRGPFLCPSRCCA